MKWASRSDLLSSKNELFQQLALFLGVDYVVYMNELSHLRRYVYVVATNFGSEALIEKNAVDFDVVSEDSTSVQVLNTSGYSHGDSHPLRPFQDFSLPPIYQSLYAFTLRKLLN